MPQIELKKIGQMSTVNNAPLVNFFKKEDIKLDIEKQQNFNLELKRELNNRDNNNTNNNILNVLEKKNDVLPSKKKYLSSLLKFELLKKRKLEKNEICIDHFKDMESYAKEIKDLENIYPFIFNETLNKCNEDILSVHRKFCNIKLGNVVDPAICFPNILHQRHRSDYNRNGKSQNTPLITRKEKKEKEKEQEHRQEHRQEQEQEQEQELERKEKGIIQGDEIENNVEEEDQYQEEYKLEGGEEEEYGQYVEDEELKEKRVEKEIEKYVAEKAEAYVEGEEMKGELKKNIKDRKIKSERKVEEHVKEEKVPIVENKKEKYYKYEIDGEKQEQPYEIYENEKEKEKETYYEREYWKMYGKKYGECRHENGERSLERHMAYKDATNKREEQEKQKSMDYYGDPYLIEDDSDQEDVRNYENVEVDNVKKITYPCYETGKVIQRSNTLGKRYIQNVSNQFVYVDDLNVYETLLLLSFTVQLQNEHKYDEREERNLEQIIRIDKRKLSHYFLRESYYYFFERNKYQCNTCGLRFFTSAEKLDHMDTHYKMNKLNILNSDKMNIIMLTKYKNKKVYLNQMNLPIEFFVCKRFTYADDLYDNIVWRHVESSGFLNFPRPVEKRNDKEEEKKETEQIDGHYSSKEHSYLVDVNKWTIMHKYSFDNTFDFTNNSNEIDTFFSVSEMPSERKKRKRNTTGEEFEVEVEGESEEEGKAENVYEKKMNGDNILIEEEPYDDNMEQYGKNKSQEKDGYAEDFFDLIYGNQNTYEIHLSKYYEMTVENNVILRYIEPETMFKNIMKCLNIKDITKYKFPSWIPKRSLNNFFVKRIVEMEESYTRENYYEDLTQNEMDRFYNIYANEEEELATKKEIQQHIGGNDQGQGNATKNVNDKKDIITEDKQKLWLLTIPDDFYKKWKLSPFKTCWEAVKLYRPFFLRKQKMSKNKEENELAKVFSIIDFLKCGQNCSKETETELLQMLTGIFEISNEPTYYIQKKELTNITSENKKEMDTNESSLYLQDKTIPSFMELFNEKRLLLTSVFKQAFLFYLRKCYFLLINRLKYDANFDEFRIFEKNIAKYIFNTYTQKVAIFDVHSGKIHDCFFCKRRFTASYSKVYRDFYYDNVVAVDMNHMGFIPSEEDMQKELQKKRKQQRKKQEKQEKEVKMKGREVNQIDTNKEKVLQQTETCFPLSDTKGSYTCSGEDWDVCGDRRKKEIANQKKETQVSKGMMDKTNELAELAKLADISEVDEMGETCWSGVNFLLHSLNTDLFFKRIKNVINENCSLNKTYIENCSGTITEKEKTNKKGKKEEDYYDQLYRSGCITHEIWAILKNEIQEQKLKNKTSKKKTKKNTHFSALGKESATVSEHMWDETVKNLVKTFQDNINSVTEHATQLTRDNQSLNITNKWSTKDFKKIIKTYIYDTPNRKKYGKGLIHYPLKKYIQVNYTYFHSFCFKKYIEYFLLPYYFISKLCDKRFKEIITITIDTFFKAYQKTCHFGKCKKKKDPAQRIKKENETYKNIPIHRNMQNCDKREFQEPTILKKPTLAKKKRKHF